MESAHLDTFRCISDKSSTENVTTQHTVTPVNAWLTHARYILSSSSIADIECSQNSEDVSQAEKINDGGT